jgi:hypothetical protein
MLGRSTNPDRPRPHVKTAVAPRHQSQHCPPLRYALRHNAISSNPCDRVDFSTHRAVGDNASFEHSSLTATQVAELCAAIAGDTTPIYPHIRPTG